MTTQTDALSLVYDAIDQVNQIRPPDKQVRKARETHLFGPDATLDSLGLVTLIVGVEERAEEATGLPIVLTDERAISTKPSVFRTVGTLADYLDQLLREAMDE